MNLRSLSDLTSLQPDALTERSSDSCWYHGETLIGAFSKKVRFRCSFHFRSRHWSPGPSLLSFLAERETWIRVVCLGNFLGRVVMKRSNFQYSFNVYKKTTRQTHEGFLLDPHHSRRNILLTDQKFTIKQNEFHKVEKMFLHMRLNNMMVEP